MRHLSALREQARRARSSPLRAYVSALVSLHSVTNAHAEPPDTFGCTRPVVGLRGYSVRGVLSAAMTRKSVQQVAAPATLRGRMSGDQMKIAFHFNRFHEELGSSYGAAARRLVFSALLRQRSAHVVSKVFVGDLPFRRVDYESWVRPQNPVWSGFLEERLTAALPHVYAICFESVDYATAERLHEGLGDSASYLGTLEVDDSSFLHWRLYSSLIPRFRVFGGSAHLFWDGVSEDDKDDGFLEEVGRLGFHPVGWESLNGRFSIFDRYHNFEHAQRVAEWKRNCGQMLGFIADSVVTRLGDAIPGLGDRLWSALRTFDQAETPEQLSQVAVTCRRIIEHVADRLSPPRETVTDGPKLGRMHYRNRLLAFADHARRADTAIDLIVASTEALDEQVTKLLAVAQKGIHAEMCRAETRRCLLRTILLLDDLVALKQGSFQIRADLDLGSLPTEGR